MFCSPYRCVGELSAPFSVIDVPDRRQFRDSTYPGMMRLSLWVGDKKVPDRDRLLSDMRVRFKFGMAKRLLERGGLPKGKSWDEVYERLDGLEFRGRQTPKLLADAFIEALISYDKLIALYAFEERHLASAHRTAMNIAANLPNHPFVDAFPLSLPEVELREMPLNEAVPVHVIELGNATAVIYSTVRLIEKREDIDVRLIDPSIVSQYEHVFGYKKTYVQSFNAIVLPYFGQIAQIYTDDASIVTPASALLDQFTIRNSFNETFGSALLSAPLNLFQAIESFYLAREEGEVALLAHTVSNGIKQEKMRNGRCVRRELFHEGGAAAVSGALTPYQITVRWDRTGEDFGGRPELSLLGSYRQSYQRDPQLTEGVIRNCGNFEEIHFVIEKLLAHRIERKHA